MSKTMPSSFCMLMILIYFLSDTSVENCVVNINNGLDAIKFCMYYNRLSQTIDKSCYMLFKLRG